MSSRSWWFFFYVLIFAQIVMAISPISAPVSMTTWVLICFATASIMEALERLIRVMRGLLSEMSRERRDQS